MVFISNLASIKTNDEFVLASMNPPQTRTMPSPVVTGGVLLSGAMFLMLGLVIPILLLLNSRGQFSLNVFLAFTVVIWSQLRLSYTALTGQRRFALICYYAFVYSFFGVQPLLSVFLHAFPNNIYLGDALVTYASLLLIIGVGAFEIGYLLGRKKTPAALLPQKTTETISLKMLWTASFSVLVLIVLIMSVYGPGFFIYGGNSFGSQDTSQTKTLLLVYGVRVPAAVLLFFSVYLWKTRKFCALSCSQIRSLKAVLLFLCLLNFLVSMPLTAPRLWMGSLLLTVFFISFSWKKVKSFVALSVFLCLSLLFLFAGTDPRRIVKQVAIGEKILPATVTLVKDAVQGLSEDANYDAFAMLAASTQYTEKSGYSWGRQLLLPAFFWVPRSVWPGKPEGTPVIVAEPLRLDHSNVSCPLWAEGYVNFGVFGLFLFLFVFGWLARRADDFQVQTTNSLGALLPTVVSSFFAANTFILLRGDLTTGTMYLQLVVFFSFVIVYVSQRLKLPRVVICNHDACARK